MEMSPLQHDSKELLQDVDSMLNQGLLAGKSALWHYTPGNNRFFISASYYLLLGYPPYESHNDYSGFIDHVHLDDKDDIETQLKQAIDQKANAISLKFRAVHRSGRRLWFSCEGESIASSHFRLVGIMTDITTSQKTQKELVESERQLKTLMNNLPGMAYRSQWVNGKWDIIFVSKGVESLFGYTRAYYMANKNAIYEKLICEEEKTRIWKIVNESISKGRYFEIVYPLITASGQDKWVWEKGEVIFDKQGQPSFMEGFMMDITTFKHEESRLKSSLKSASHDRYRFGDIIGKSAAMQSIYEVIEQASASDANVIVYGASGTGKELVARAIHQASQRCKAPLVSVNCGAIPAALMESEFFGHKKGAFSGAHAYNEGFLEAAQDGILFLDEVGEISLEFQVKLLRILDGHGYTPVGSNEVKKTNIRVIAATNRNLSELVKQGKMREDFFYRIHIIPITLPPLKKRREDISLLIDHFLPKYQGKEKNTEMPGYIRDTLQKYHWPGNVRQLENTIQRYVALGNIELDIHTTGTQLSSLEGESLPIITDDLKNAVETFEKQFLLNVLKKNEWKRGKTAQALGVTPRTLYRKMIHYRLK